MSWLRDALPILEWGRSYRMAQGRRDLVAGLTVGIMLVPQGMAYAVLAGVPPIYGLYASLVPLLVYPLFGTSRHLAVGVVAVDMLIIAAGVGALAEPGTDRYIQLAILLAILAGIVQLGMGLARLGFLANLLSRPVIAGFISAAALIIVFSQAGSLLGIDLARSEHLHQLIREAVLRLSEAHPPTLAIGLGSILVLSFLQWWKPYFPSQLLVIVAGILAVVLLGLQDRGVVVVGEIPGGLPSPGLPALELGTLRDLLPTVLTLALVQFMSVASLTRVFASRHRYSTDPNQELIGIGAGNVVGGIFQCIPASGSFSRSAVNEQAGAVTPMANVFAALLVALVLLFLTPLFHDLPLASLAAIIIVAASGLVDFQEIRYLFRTRPGEGWIATFTFACTLTIGIEEGLLLGISAATLTVLYRWSRPELVELGHLSATHSFRNLARFSKAYSLEGLLILRIEGGFSFFNANYFKEYVLSKIDGERKIRAVVVDGMSINDLDTTAIEALRGLVESLEARDIEIHLAGLTGPIRDVVERSGLGEFLGEDRFHMSPHRAVRHLLEKWDASDDTARLKSYDRSTEMDRAQVQPTADTDYV